MGKSAQELYNEREKRIQDAIQLKKADRVPIMPFDTGWRYKYMGMTCEDAHYDYAKCHEAIKKSVTDIQFDVFSPSLDNSGIVYDLLDFRQLKWAGAKREESRVGPTSLFQFVEPNTEYEGMSEKDYDWFLDDPGDYIMRKHVPNLCAALAPLKTFPPLHCMCGWFFGFMETLAHIGSPDGIKAFERMLEAGKEAHKWFVATVGMLKEMNGLGFPCIAHGFTIAPFDYFADLFRGTRGAMVDMYRAPDKLKKACEKVTPWLIEWGIHANKAFCDLTGMENKRVQIPIHKAAGKMMSNKQHEEFFWPGLREVIIGLIDAGLTPYVYTEGDYTERLPAIKDVPKGKVLYNVEVDIFEAKKVLGDTACIKGGPPSSIMNTGTPEDVKEYCKKLIDVCGDGGGFIMGVQLPLLTDKVENVKDLVDFTKEYGVYT